MMAASEAAAEAATVGAGTAEVTTLGVSASCRGHQGGDSSAMPVTCEQ